MRSIILALGLLMHLAICYGQIDGPKLRITHLTGDFYIYTTYNTYEGNTIPANGMYVVTKDGVVPFDTPWDTSQFQPLLDSIQLKHQKNVAICLATHWHSDRTEGLENYWQKGIKTYTTKLTDELSKTYNKKRAANLIERDTIFNIGKYSFETYYPGPGHTKDNIVVWFKNERILYGGCLIKENLGFLGDGDVQAYKTTLKKVKRKCPRPNFIIVSHNDWRNPNSLKHSIKLAKKLKGH